MDAPDDQRADDARSLIYDWAPLDDELEILGHPRLRLTVTSPTSRRVPLGKLCDVFPDGTSALVTRGVLNLTHRSGHTAPEPLEPGVPTAIEIELEATSWIFEPGHRVRLALAGSDWPNTWPPPQPARSPSIERSVELELPVLDGPSPAPPPIFEPPTTARHRHDDDSGGDQPPVVRRIEHDVLGRRDAVATSYGSRYDGALEAKVEERYDGVVGVSTGNPRTRVGECATVLPRSTGRRPPSRPRRTCEVRSTATAYHVVVEVIASEDAAEAASAMPRASLRAHDPAPARRAQRSTRPAPWSRRLEAGSPGPTMSQLTA